MLEKILRFSVERRGVVLIVVIAAAIYGAYSLSVLPIDAVPDITNRQVKISALAPALTPEEVEKLVAFPLETSLRGIAGLDYTRSLSRNGYVQVTAVFSDAVDIYFARQQVSERLAQVASTLPPGVEVSMGPIATGLSEVYMWTVEYEPPGSAPVAAGVPGWQPDGSYLTPEGASLRTEVELGAFLRTVQDWIIRPQVATVSGVAGVDAVGGYVKQYQVQPDPYALAAHGLTFADLLEALEAGNSAVGAGIIETNGEGLVVRAAGRLTTLADFEDLLVAEHQGVPIRLADIAQTVIGGELRRGSASENGEEVVLGTALMRVGENSRTVSAAVDQKMEEVRRSLPSSIHVKTVLDRTRLVDATIRTVRDNLVEGALLVIVLLFLMLGNFRAAVITAMAIPLSMLLAAVGMVQTKTSGSLMSLGAIDFGLIVDGAVIIVENCLRRLGERQAQLGRILTREERLETVFEASKQVRSATAFGETIIIIVYLPILALSGVEGKMFQPMALTVIFALTAAFVLSLTFVPAMVALVVTGRVQEGEGRLLAAAKRVYEPVVRQALRLRYAVVAVAVVLFLGALVLLRSLGQEFVPTLSELDILVHAMRIPSTSVSQATVMQRDLERRLQAVPEIEFVFSRTGTGELGTDAMPPYVSDTFLMLKPRSEWPDPSDTKADVQARVQELIETIPGQAYEFTQPIQMLFNELIAGVRADIAVRVFGDEFDEILPVAEQIAAALRTIPGAADTRVEQVTGAPVLNVDVDRSAIAPYGLSVADVHDVVQIAVGGREAGQVFEGDRRFDVVVRLPESARSDRNALENLPIPLTHQDEAPLALTLAGDDVERAPPRFLPLSAVAEVGVVEGPNQISRQNGKRRVLVQTNVRGRDIGSFVEEAQRRVAARVELPAGTWLSWGGQFENLVRAKQRLSIVVPFCFLVILALLYGTFGSIRPALMVFTGVPMALSGGILSLWLREMPFSISAAVGFIALSGVAVLNGLVMITFVNQLREEGMKLDRAIVAGAVTRLRPVLMTALVASLGFLPMALATGTGAEVQRPLATVVVGGLASSTLLTLVVLPALYRIFAERD